MSATQRVVTKLLNEDAGNMRRPVAEILEITRPHAIKAAVSKKEQGAQTLLHHLKGGDASYLNAENLDPEAVKRMVQVRLQIMGVTEQEVQNELANVAALRKQLNL